MQTIYRTIPASNFVSFTNDHVSSAMPSDDKNVLNHLLSKPKNWQLKVTEICSRLHLSPYKVRKALKRLRIAGYVFMQRLRGGFTRWFIYSEPKKEIPNTIPVPPVIMPHVKKSHIKNLDVLVINTDHKKIKTQQPVPLEEQQKTVVVSVEENEQLIYPEKLTQNQKKACKATIKKAPVAIQQEILFELAYRMTVETIRTVPGYLNKLVVSANNGTFTRTGTSGATKASTRQLDKTQATLDKYRQIKSTQHPGCIKNLRAAIFS